MKIPFQDFSALHAPYEHELQAAFSRVLKSDWYILGTEVTAFENEFAEYLDAKHCIGVANGLEALQISLMALGIGKGDEVITTPLSAVATTLAILAVGATPVFVDTDARGLITATGIESAISKRTKAVLPVHLYGNALDLDAISAVCEKHSLFLIEDAAQAHGTKYKDKMVGTQGIFGCFSFYPTKNLGALGDGGAIVTSDANLASICRQIRDYGQDRKYNHVRLGLNSRLDEVQAAILRVKLQHLDAENAQRAKVAEQYATLATVSPSYSISNNHLFVLRTKKRDELQQHLKQNGVEALVHYPTSIPDQPMFGTQYIDLQIPETRALCKEILSIPCYPSMKSEQVAYVCAVINEFSV